MLEEVAAHPAAAGGASIAVYWGNRAEEDFYWAPPERLSVSFHRVLSRPTSAWSGRTGYVQDAVIADGIDLSTAMVYACGSQAMIEAAAQSFRARGLPDHRFQFDAFVSSASVE
jgi:CDP-4-dehydro-6-deoxyglucose reductase